MLLTCLSTGSAQAWNYGGGGGYYGSPFGMGGLGYGRYGYGNGLVRSLTRGLNGYGRYRGGGYNGWGRHNRGRCHKHNRGRHYGWYH
ncbi:MAG: hypothetical protein AB7W16_20470 [Candidatus Obscuribacterales bacterium]